MEYQAIINLLDNTTNQPTNFRAKNWVEINDNAHGRYYTNIQIKFKTSMLKSSSCDYSDAGATSITPQKEGNPNNTNKEVEFKNCAPCTDCISEINYTQIVNAKDNDVVMVMYNLIKYSDNYSKISGSLIL